MTEENNLDDGLGAELLTLPVDEPPPDFAERVVQKHLGVARPPRRAPKSRHALRAGAIVLVAAAAMLLFVGKRPALRSDIPSGSLTALGGRETVKIGKRATLVAETGTVIRWDPSNDGVLAQQSEGNVFYRVEPGRPFVVRTPIGDVTVEGTSFRVEIMDMKKSWQAVAGAVTGALLVVTVYEGRVLLANPVGEVRVEAGERGTAAPGQLPAKQDARVASAIDVPAPDENATRDDLLTRDSVQRQEIAQLRARVRDLEKLSATSAGGPPPRIDPDGRPWFSPSEETLKTFVKDCRVRSDTPPFFDTETFRMGPNMASRMNLNVEEWEATNKVFASMQQSVQARVRALFIEATGDTRGAETLSATAMQNEVFDKANPAEMVDLRRRIASERAGLTPPPADLSKLPATERLFRMKVELGNETESAIAGVLGKERARELRGKDGGWGWQQEVSGCSATGDDDSAD